MREPRAAPMVIRRTPKRRKQGAKLEQQTISPPRRTPFIDVLDKVIGAGRRMGAVSPARLTSDALLDQARAETGLEDFGDEWFGQPFEVLLESVRNEARLNHAGTFAARSNSTTSCATGSTPRCGSSGTRRYSPGRSRTRW